MAMVRVKNKYQVVIPERVRAEIGIAVGDVLEAQAERGKIVFTPKTLVDRAVAEGLEDIRKGRVHGPFESVEQMLASLKGKNRKPPRRANRRSR